MQAPPPMDASHDQAAAPPSRPALPTNRSSAAILGDITWLMMESPSHRRRTVADFARLVLPPIKLRQFRLFHDGHIPIAFISWALLSPEAEHRYIDDPHALKPEDWMSGNAIYIADLVASRNAVRKIATYLRRDPLISTGPVRGIKQRHGARMIIEVFADDRGRHVKARRLPDVMDPAEAASLRNETVAAESSRFGR
jgi:cytolysin-activating lysine-acyltransferase